MHSQRQRVPERTPGDISFPKLTSDPMRIVITGAAGNIAGPLIEELQLSHELRLIDRRPVLERPSIIADLSKRSPIGNESAESEWQDAFEGADAVVHLAANIQHTTSGQKCWTTISKQPGTFSRRLRRMESRGLSLPAPTGRSKLLNIN